MTDVCFVCKRSQPISELIKDKHAKIGYKRLCKPCNNKRNRVNLENGIFVIPPEIVDGFMAVDMPIYEKRLEIITQHHLDIDDENDTIEIVKLLKAHGLE